MSRRPSPPDAPSPPTAAPVAARVLTGASDPLVGTTLAGAYHIVERIGSGGMALVYRARQIAVGRDVAVKVVRESTGRALGPVLVERFRREALVTSRLSHPNTVRLIDFGEDRHGRLYLVLELLRGRPLVDLLAEEGALPPARAAHIGAQICRALADAHEQGVVHRDLKPENVFVGDYQGEKDVVKVMDFGLARLVSGETPGLPARRLTATGIAVGTPLFMSPEQRRGLEATPASDLYSVGVMLYELLTGHVPFTGASLEAIHAGHLNEAPPPLALEGLPADELVLWQDLVASLLSKDPADRPAHAADVAVQLEALRAASLAPEVAARASAIQPRPEVPAPLPTLEKPSPLDATPDEPATGSAAGWLALLLAVVAVVVSAMAWSNPDAPHTPRPPPREAPATEAMPWRALEPPELRTGVLDPPPARRARAQEPDLWTPWTSPRAPDGPATCPVTRRCPTPR